MLFLYVFVSMSFGFACTYYGRCYMRNVRPAKLKQKLDRSGVEADAIVLNLEKTKRIVQHKALMKLQLQVQPQSGRNFVLEVREAMKEIEEKQLRVGSILKVKYNPANTREVMVMHEMG